MEFTVGLAADSIFWVGEDSRFVHANQAACRLLGYSCEELTGMSVSDIDPHFPPERWLSHFNELKQKGKLRFESAHRTKSGRIIPVEVTVNYIRHEGKSYNVAFARDITERKTASDMLAESKRFLTTIIDAIPDAIIAIDRDHRVVLANRAACDFAGGVDPVATGMKCHELFHRRLSPCEGPSDTCPMIEVFKKRGPVVVHHQHYDAAGGEHTIEITAAPVFNEEGQIVQMIEACRDITERMRAERALRQATEQLKRSNEDLEQFAYVASHDLQEPIRVISGFAKLLERQTVSDSGGNGKKYVAFIRDEAARMNQLITNLLQYSRISSQGGNFELTDAGNVLRRAIEGLQVSIQENHAEITHDPLPVVKADAMQLMRVFQNLISNAVKFKGTDPPKVHIGITRQENEYLFSVSDNGIGIDPQYRQQIFTIFQRLHGRDNYSGSGIGLAICKKIVERHGGRIWVVSQPEKGSTFYFTIPREGGDCLLRAG